MKITLVRKSSPAARAGIRAGEEILSIDGEPIRDRLDLIYHAADEELDFEIRSADGAVRHLTVTRVPGEDLGLTVPEDPIRCCGNRCIFCFVDQNPKGLRRSLYVKDEDYRLSLLYGNYVTLTNLREWEMARIVEQHLSPLYISVHATDPEVRRRLLRPRGDAEILPRMRRLQAAGIRMHTQIVLVPEYNDGEVLEQTLDDLESLHPGIESVAIVPVGLTSHRNRLPALRPVTPEEAAEIIDRVTVRQARCRSRWGSRRHYLADELYLLAGRALPSEEAYEDFPQIENGVGMVRRFESELRGRVRLFAAGAKTDRAMRVGLVTGTLFAPILTRLLPEALERTGEAQGFDVRVLAVHNRFLGPGVTVAGLLSGVDVVQRLGREDELDLVLLPPDMLSADGVTLDDQTPQQLAHTLRRPVQVGLGGDALFE